MAYSEFGSGSSALFGASSYFTEQVSDSERGYARGPERALLSALLFDGIQAFMNYVCAETESQKEKYVEAYNWVVRTGEDYVFSFESVCEALGVDPEFFRLGLLGAVESVTYEWRKTRRNF